MSQLTILPDLLCDGQGIAHPRRFGIACHLGLLVDTPAIGVAKSLLVGRHAEVADERGAWQPLIHRDETVGVALRTRPKTKPLYISSGHRISLATAIEYVMGCTTAIARQKQLVGHTASPLVSLLNSAFLAATRARATGVLGASFRALLQQPGLQLPRHLGVVESEDRACG